MSVVHSYGKKIIPINEISYIEVETKSEDGYEWDEVTFTSKEDEKGIYIGSYYTYNYSSSREWMEYNSDYITLLAIYSYGYENSDTTVKKVFDVNFKQLVEGSQEKLLKIYNQEFKGTSKKKTLSSKVNKKM